MKITGTELREWWAKGTPVRYHGEMYKVHRMSYGDYFLEPTSWQGGERDGFAPDTQWFYKKDAKRDIYGLESNRV